MNLWVRIFLFMQIFFVLGASAIAESKVILKAPTQYEITSTTAVNNYNQPPADLNSRENPQDEDTTQTDVDNVIDNELLISLFSLTYPLVSSDNYYSTSFQSPPQPELSVSTPPPKK
jgi:hypothetical protein